MCMLNFLLSWLMMLMIVSSTGHNAERSSNTNMATEVHNEKLVQYRSCPCADPALCERVKTIPQYEVFVFSTNNKSWRDYDWDKITSVVEVGYYDDDLMCYAHSRGVRVLDIISFPVAQLTNSSARTEWIAERIDVINEHFLDGINLDFESEIDMEKLKIRQGLTNLTKELTTAVKSLGSYMQVTFDFAWSPDCIDQRCYDYKDIANIVDFVVLMAYDERSQIKYECIAWANSAFNTTAHGLQRYISIGIDPSKLVLAIPWCGYRYPCESYNQTTNKCHIREVPYHGVNCSDAAGVEVGYGVIWKLMLPSSFTGRLWDTVAESPYFSYKDKVTGHLFQVWYDDPTSLATKYRLAARHGIRGVSMWNADKIDYSDKEQVMEFWGGLPGR